MSSQAYADLFFDALRAAKDARASDLHVESRRDDVTIRMRVFKEMQDPWKQIGPDHRRGFMQQLKASAGLDVAVSGRPQDARLSVPDLKHDFRVNLLPTLHGERVVLRLLDMARSFDLESLGLDTSTMSAIKSALGQKDGVILISGPTGSGKTTTLYSMLCALNQGTKNIITLEDPVEFAIDGLSQVNIDRKLSFAAALRAVLRQDPDVILVGEIRDKETAELAFQAASTGHLVLSTIHANSAVDVVTRLTGLGVEPYLIESYLGFSLAQRFAQRVCLQCREPLAGSERAELLRSICPTFKVRIGASRLWRKGSGCPECRGGITGLIPVAEFIDRAAIRGSRPAGLRCVKPMADACLDLALQGVVDPWEVVSLA